MRFRCLDFRFSLSADVPETEARLDELFAACRDDDADGAAGAELRVVTGGPRRDEVVVLDGDHAVFGPGDLDTAIAHVVWEVNRRTVEASDGYLLVHGAAAARDGLAVVVAAPSGAGKSTFVSELVRAGWAYVTDEVVAVDLVTRLVVPYPKPIAVARDGGVERFVAPGAARSGVAAPSRPRAVLVPDRRAGASVSFEPLTRAETVVHLAEHSFNFRRVGCDAFEAAVAVARESVCLRVRYGEAAAAVRALESQLVALEEPR